MWFAVQTAQSLEQVMWDVCAAAMPGHDAWTKPHFNYEGVGSNYRTDGRAEIGDVVTYEVQTPPVMISTGCEVSSKYWVLGFVTAINADGLVIGVRSYSGEALHEPKRLDKIHILPAAQFDMAAVSADLQKRSALRREDGFNSYSRGAFSGRGEAASALAEFLLPRVAQRIRAEDVERAIAHACGQFSDPFQYIPINLPALQAQLDRITDNAVVRHQPEPLRLAA